MVEALLATGYVDVNGQEVLGHTPLAIAAFLSQYKAVNLLLSVGGADPNLPDACYGRAPLGHAAQAGNLDVGREIHTS